MKLRRRQFLHLAAGAAALPAMSRMASAQAYPARPVTIVVPFAAGGSSDVSARIIGEYMARTLGQQFIIENVVGAGGTTGSLRAMRARPDGYTILMGHIGTHAFSVSLYPKLAYKPDVDFGTIKAYAVVATERHPILPNVPTTIEAGLPEFQALPWWALFAPKGVPQPILDALTDALDKALDDEQLRKRFSDLGGDIPGKERRGQQPLAALVKSEIARWTPIIKAANVTIG